MVVNTVANLVNILFNWLLINGIWVFPKLLVAGAAYATLLSRVVGFLLVLRVFLSGKFVLQISFRNGYHPDFNLVRRILNVGLPAAGEQFIMWGGMLLYARVVSGLGTDVYAAHQVANNIESLAYIPVFGFSMAATPLVGQSLGAQKPKRAARYGMGTCYAAMAVATVAGLALLLAPRLMAKLYTDSLPVIDMSVMALRLIGWFEPIQAAMFVIMACLRGAGDTRYPLYVSLAGVWLVRVVFSNIFVSLGWGLQGAWYAMAMDITVRSVLAFWRYRTGKWQTARV
jgi:putative MATE family efflux protein